LTEYFCIKINKLFGLDFNFSRKKVIFNRKMPLSCRFYKHKFPECEEVVMVNVRQIAEMGSYVNLLEYNKIEGSLF